MIIMTTRPSPDKELGVIDPLVDEVTSDGLGAVLKVHAIQAVNEQYWVVVQSSNGHLQTHGPELTALDSPHQSLHDHLHKQRDAL